MSRRWRATRGRVWSTSSMSRESLNCRGPSATKFGASGRMRERIEAGERVDVFTSADVGHARKLVDEGRASVMALFAQNTLCFPVPARSGPVDGIASPTFRCAMPARDASQRRCRPSPPRATAAESALPRRSV
ncbi:substrate-binding domain-containing protein [Variovorax sp. SRS16]|uniref:substrate-binding domain-containing protein n=1 Tax=Variovorax sp. SRS16 TaxID=282217 RepID=UPI0013A535F6